MTVSWGNSKVFCQRAKLSCSPVAFLPNVFAKRKDDWREFDL